MSNKAKYQRTELSSKSSQGNFTNSRNRKLLEKEPGIKSRLVNLQVKTPIAKQDVIDTNKGIRTELVKKICSPERTICKLKNTKEINKETIRNKAFKKLIEKKEPSVKIIVERKILKTGNVERKVLKERNSDRPKVIDPNDLTMEYLCNYIIDKSDY